MAVADNVSHRLRRTESLPVQRALEPESVSRLATVLTGTNHLSPTLTPRVEQAVHVDVHTFRVLVWAEENIDDDYGSDDYTDDHENNEPD
ncbi:hypothetical protein [Brevibacterium sp.]|uniref:hypothetical protein n=1 Tax=Brevibacterium sp. TaxID=1701 RepID=UPI002810C950|nr:hypothetical protein [Brevibacterium sp.]